MDCPKCSNHIPYDEYVCPFCGCHVTALDKQADNERRRRAFLERESSLAHKAKIRQLRAADQQPIRAVRIRSDKQIRKHTMQTVSRGVIGGFLFGTIGAAIGILTSKPDKEVFRVTYASGRIATVTVTIGSTRYLELSDLADK